MVFVLLHHTWRRFYYVFSALFSMYSLPTYPFIVCNEANLSPVLSFNQKIVVSAWTQWVCSCDLAPWAQLVIWHMCKFWQIAWYFSEKALSITSTCGKYPWYKLIYCTNNPELMLKIFSYVYHTRSPIGHQLSTANSLCSCTDYNLLIKGEDQVEICFIEHYEWIAKQSVWCNSVNQCFLIVHSCLIHSSLRSSWIMLHECTEKCWLSNT